MKEKPDINENEQHFDKVFSKKPVIEYHLDIENMGKKDKSIVKLLEKFGVKDKKCLDIGPGTGRWLKFMKYLGADEICAVELSDVAIQRCSAFCDRIYKINVENDPLPFETESFDIIISFEVIEHLYSPTNYLTEMLRVLRKNGLLIMSTPNMISFASRIRMLMGGLPIAVGSDPTHKKFYRQKDIIGLFIPFDIKPKFVPTSISFNPFNPKSKMSLPSFKGISSFDDSLVFYFLNVNENSI